MLSGGRKAHRTYLHSLARNIHALFRIAALFVRRYSFAMNTILLERDGVLKCKYRNIKLFQKVVLYRYGGRYAIGNHVQFGYDIGGRCKRGYCELQSRDNDACISIGDNTAINNNFLAICRNKISIGKNCRIGINCLIMDFEAHSIDPTKRSIPGEVGEVVIGDNVWIGNNVTVLKNVKVGKNSIIGAGSIVTRDVGENMIVAGIPARVIRRIE